MPTRTVMALRGLISIHGRPYEMHCGYMTPNDLILMAAVPSFERDTSHHSIANSLRTPPIDHWQRPLDAIRLEKIRINVDAANLGNSDNDSLMTNPVLIGRSDKVGQAGVSLAITPHTVESGQTTIPVTEVNNITVTSRGNSKPLWILDGQHRIHGLGNSPMVTNDAGAPVDNASIVAEETIPVVFIVDDAYTPNFLAQIFTEVTTEAKPMDTLHADWMKYAFDMGEYADSNARNGMAATVELSTIQEIDAIANEFCAAGGQIKFNPHQPIEGVGPLRWDAPAFRKMFEDEYYRKGGTGNAAELSTAFVRFFRAARETDSRSNTNSKLMSQTAAGAHTSLVEAFFVAFLNHLATDSDLLDYEKDDWVEFLTTNERQFQEADWSLEDAGSTQPNRAFKSAKKSSAVTFSKFFGSPGDFEDEDPASWLQGPGAIQIQSSAIIASGVFPPRRHTPRQEVAGGGTITIRLRDDGHKWIRFRGLEGSQASICDVNRREGREWVSIGDKTARIDLQPGNNTESIRVGVICYGEDTYLTTTFRFIS